MPDAPTPGQPRSVLIADDHEQVRRVLVDYVTMILESEALEASNGLEALWIVKHRRPDVVLLDLTMPRLGGLEAIRHIRRFDPRIRIVVITGDARDQTRHDIERLGLEMLVKPIDLRDLDAMFGRAA